MACLKRSLLRSLDTEAYSKELLRRKPVKVGGRREQGAKKEVERGKINFEYDGDDDDVEGVDDAFTLKSTGGSRRKKPTSRRMEEELGKDEDVVHKMMTSRRYDIETFLFEHCFTKTQESIIEFQRDLVEINVEEEFDVNEDPAAAESKKIILYWFYIGKNWG